MVDLVSKCRTHLFPENAGDLLPDIALSGQLERRGVIVPGPDNSVQYLLFARDPPQLVTGHTGGNDNARVIVEHIVALQMVRISRSEEHKSELQSLMRRSYAVFCLKKKNNHQLITNTNTPY